MSPATVDSLSVQLENTTVRFFTSHNRDVCISNHLRFLKALTSHGALRGSRSIRSKQGPSQPPEPNPASLLRLRRRHRLESSVHGVQRLPNRRNEPPHHPLQLGGRSEARVQDPVDRVGDFKKRRDVPSRLASHRPRLRADTGCLLVVDEEEGPSEFGEGGEDDGVGGDEAEVVA